MKDVTAVARIPSMAVSSGRVMTRAVSMGLLAGALAACSNPPPPAAEAALRTYMDALSRRDFRRVAELTDPAVAEEEAARSGRTPEAVRQAFLETVSRDPDLGELRSYAIGDFVRYSDDKYGYVVTELVVRDGKEERGVETFHVLKKGGRWYVRVAEVVY